MATIQGVMTALGLGEYQEATISVYFDEVVEFIKGAGVPEAAITTGLVARGVVDIWNYGIGEGRLSEYFKMRVAQLALNGRS
jgi:hypothetical protein